MEPTKLLEGLFDKKRMVLLKFFLDHPSMEYGVREMAKATRLAPATTFRIIHQLKSLNLIEERRIKKLRLYHLAQNKATEFLDEILAVKKSAIEEFKDSVTLLPNVEKIILHGKPTKEKASLLVIGENVDTVVLSRTVGEIKERYNFSILYLTLSRDQYEQMSSMGLYSGEKQVLFTR